MVHQHFAHSINVHDASSRKMKYRFLQPRRTIRVDATAYRFPFRPHHVSAAIGAGFGHHERPPALAFLNHPDNLRNHIARALN